MNVRVLMLRKGADEPLIDQLYTVGEGKDLTFGRAESGNRLHIPDEKLFVSSSHGRIFIDRDRLWLEDIGSTNGTLLDGKPLPPKTPAPVASGSQIVLGDYSLTLEVERPVFRESRLDVAGDPAHGELAGAAYEGLDALAIQFVGAPLRHAEDIDQFVERLREFATQALDWLARSMLGRAEFQRQFAAEVTLILQRSKNPLKGQGAESLGRTLLDWSSESERDKVYAQLANAIEDFSKHQLGLLEGVKEAIASIAERIAPDTIEALAAKDAGIFANKKARAWTLYKQIFGEYFEENSKLFHEVISPSIRKGYLNSFDADRAGDARPDEESS